VSSTLRAGYGNGDSIAHAPDWDRRFDGDIDLTVAPAQSFDASNAPSNQSLRALDGVNFFVAASLAGFGPFVALVLGAEDWSQESIGLVLSAGGVAGCWPSCQAARFSMSLGRRGSWLLRAPLWWA
jgi:hypothetical protein